jgi:hypothetical protein
VDVYAVADPTVGASGPSDVSLVVGAAPVQAISGRAEGVLSTATTTVQVVVSVPVGRAPAVLEAIAGRPLVVVVHESVDAAPAAGAAGTGAPAVAGRSGGAGSAAGAPAAGVREAAPSSGRSDAEPADGAADPAGPGDDTGGAGAEPADPAVPVGEAPGAADAGLTP